MRQPPPQARRIFNCLLPLLLAAWPGCATAPPAGSQTPGTSAGGPSSVDISYVLGHNQRRFHAESKAEGVKAQAFLDKQIVDEGTIDRDRYAGFLQKVTTFVDASAKLAIDQSCRTPFTITLKVGEETRVLRGCRSSDEGGISHLVRDGEFLLSAKKN